MSSCLRSAFQITFSPASKYWMLCATNWTVENTFGWLSVWFLHLMHDALLLLLLCKKDLCDKIRHENRNLKKSIFNNALVACCCHFLFETFMKTLRYISFFVRCKLYVFFFYLFISHFQQSSIDHTFPSIHISCSPFYLFPCNFCGFSAKNILAPYHLFMVEVQKREREREGIQRKRACWLLVQIVLKTRIAPYSLWDSCGTFSFSIAEAFAGMLLLVKVFCVAMMVAVVVMLFTVDWWRIYFGSLKFHTFQWIILKTYIHSWTVHPKC